MIVPVYILNVFVDVRNRIEAPNWYLVVSIQFRITVNQVRFPVDDHTERQNHGHSSNIDEGHILENIAEKGGSVNDLVYHVEGMENSEEDAR